MSSILRGGHIVSHSGGFGPYRGFDGDVLIENGQIESVIEPGSPAPGAVEINVSGMWLVPGFSQGHTHLIQTLFRGMADDLELLDWLRQRIWPLESAHDAESAYWSARLGLTEMLLGGTTTILDMASVHHTDSVFEAAAECGIHAHIGKAMMDRPNQAGLSEPTDVALQTSCDLRDKWHNTGRLRYAFAPRFVPSCTHELLTGTVKAARSTGCLIHSHASENHDEVELVRSLTGMDNVAYLQSVGMVGPDVVLAHCIHLTADEKGILGQSRTGVAHCPGSNFKLGSGTAEIPELLEHGVRVVLGADGAPCNNRMDIFAEMRLAALMQKPRLGPTSITAQDVLHMATHVGAAVLRTDGGDIAPGCRADIVALDPNQPHSLGAAPPSGTMVYAMTPANVRHVWIEGERVVEDGSLSCWDLQETLTQSLKAAKAVKKRAGL